jgi:phosphopantothenoylcysteine decarboxylase / phosphopantothenate---cysteine ligase
MGLALTSVALELGAEVCLVLGPVRNNPPEHPNLRVIPVDSAAEMYEACLREAPQAAICILAAAVSDFSPAETAGRKIKRGTEDWSILLKPTRDIAAALGARKKKGQFLAGFALETHEAEKNARKKLKDKNLDLIVLNSLQEEGAGFGYDTNKITLIGKDNFISTFELKSKKEVAADILQQIEKWTLSR